METEGTTGTILNILLSLILFIIFAIIYFVILLFIMNLSANLVFGKDHLDAGSAVLATAILTAATLLGGGTLKFFGDKS